MLPRKALDAATAVGPGEPIDLEGVFGTYSLVVSTIGSPTSARVDLQGSFDGIDWFATGVSVTTTTTGHGSVADSHLWRFLRANLITLTGGSAPTVTALVASA